MAGYDSGALVTLFLGYLMPALLLALTFLFVGLGLILRNNWRRYSADPLGTRYFSLAYFILGGILTVAMAAAYFTTLT